MAAGETIIIYGPLTFFNVLTRHVNQEILYDDSGTDAIGFKFTVSVIGHIHGLSSAIMGMLPTLGDNNAANNLSQIRCLLAPRQHFEMRCGVTIDAFGNIANPGTAILLCDPSDQQGSTDVSLRDISNGPRAQCINVTKISANSMLKCDLEFEFCQTQCAPDGSTGNRTGVLNNRWTVVDDINCDNWMTTRTFTGKLRLSSAQINPHSFRNLVVPPLQQGMRRAHMQFTASEDGLSLLYTVTDAEIAFAPPAPATTWNATFGQRIDYSESLGHFYDANITMGGDRNCDLKKLVSIASAMALSKFSNGIPQALRGKDTTYRVLSINVVEHYSDTAAGISFAATAQRVDFQGPDMLGLNTTNLGVPIRSQDISLAAQAYDSKLSRGLRVGESLETAGPISVVAAFSAYLQNGCGIQFSINNGIPAQVLGQPQGGGGTTVSATVTNDIPADGSITNVYGNANGDGIYTHVKIQVEEDTDTGRVVCPIASGASSASSSSGTGNSYQDFLNGQVGSTVVDLYRPNMKKSAIIDMEREGKPPADPAINDSTDGKTKILGKKTTILNPIASADGKKIYRKQTRVWWWEQVPLGVGSGPSGDTITGAGPAIFYFPFRYVDVTEIKPPSDQTPPGYQQGF